MFFIIGIVCRKAEKPIGFFANAEPPKVKDVRKYNDAVSLIWFYGGGVMELLGVPLLFCRQNSPVFIISVIGAVFTVIAMAAVYMMTEDKYKE